MIDHISINVSNPEASIAFHAAVLEPLGYRIVMEHGLVVGIGAPLPNVPENTPTPLDLWIVSAKNPTPCHTAVSVSSVKQVNTFYQAVIATGGADNGEPGEHPHYHPDYHAALVLGPGGNNLETAFHGN